MNLIILILVIALIYKSEKYRYTTALTILLVALAALAYLASKYTTAGKFVMYAYFSLILSFIQYTIYLWRKG